MPEIAADDPSAEAASRRPIFGEEAEGATALLHVPLDLTGEARTGGGARRRPRR